jgi:D-alanyl-lipoteichoic acid acyltransferase DltB (MBOAT superfamily)
VVFLGGLFKKVVIADNVAPYADMAFALGGAISTVEAWAGALAFALQLYFDFCGYSEMAVGLGLMLGIVLPLNFDRPYRATSMVDFWKRWHMTMTRFFMMYVYAPLAVSLGRASHGGGRPGLASFALAVAAPTMAAFLLSGLWHGAGWTFVAFGAVNGLGLVVNHAWRLARPFPVPAPLGRFLTALTVLVSFVYFRATDLGHAHAFLRAMFDPGRFLMPNWLSGLAERTGMAWTTLAMFSSGAFAVRMAVWLALAAALSVVLPNWAKAWREIRPRWRLAWGMALAVCLIGTWLGQPRTFIYFQF